MAMFQNSIRPQVLIDLAEMRLLLGVPAGSRNTGLAVNNNERVPADCAGRIKGSERDDHRCRVAARVCDQPRASYFVSEEVSQTIDRFLQELWRSVLESVPLRIQGR